MEELYKDINNWIEECDNGEIDQLAEILVEGFLNTMRENIEELKVEFHEEDKNPLPPETLYY